MPNENLQTRTKNALSDLGEKIFLDRYAMKDAKKETLAVGDTVIVCTNLKTGQREIGTVETFDRATRDVGVRLRDGAIEVRSIENVDKPTETVPEQMFARIARHVASVEKTPELQTEWERKFGALMDDWRYVPAGRIFTGAGTGQNLTFYNCYVVPCPEDSRGGIFSTLGQMAEIMSRGGGVGINVSTLRPRYAYVKGVNGRSSGSVSWASLYSFVTGLIEQGGSRRGALMLILNVWHPDVMDFIKAKQQAGKIENANISVGITDAFMEAVKADADWDLGFPDTSDALYKEHWQGCQGDIRKWVALGGKVVKYKTVKAREIWDAIISSAWSSAEPGVYFIDRANYYSNSWYYASLPCTNPCGEQPLPAWGVCNLGHVNLAKHLTQDSHDVDWHQLRDTVATAIRFQDNVIDATPYFFDENYKQQMSERRVGMGSIGLAEMLIKLGIRYGSDECSAFLDKLYQFIAVTAYETSVNLAREKGAFSALDTEKFLQSGFMQSMPEYIRSLVRQYGIRNVTLMTQAPTGTVGTMVGTSTGVEPFYSWTYFRKARLGVHEEKIALAKDWLDAHPGENLPQYFVTALELMPEEHVKVQAAIQRWTDSAISKTCNAPHDYTVGQTKDLYEKMYDMGCKGGTIYRDGSRSEQILATDSKNLGQDAVDQLEKAKEKVSVDVAVTVTEKTSEPVHAQHEEHVLQVDPHNPNKIMVKQLVQNGTRYEIIPRERPSAMHGTTYKTNTPYGNMFVTVNDDEHGPFEVFAQLGKNGGFFSAMTEAICRLISIGLRSGVGIDQIINQIKGIRSTDVAYSDGEIVYSLPDAIGKVIERHVNRSQQTLSLAFKEQQSKSAAEQVEVIHEQVTVESSFGSSQKMSAMSGAAAGAGASGSASGASSMSIDQKISIANFGYAPVCPTCSSMLQFQEGCMKCESCGYSKCG